MRAVREVGGIAVVVIAVGGMGSSSKLGKNEGICE
jgi:hypothetical protein